ncbi:MAG: lipid A 3-O-deacylase [Gammaproteobacteria bacterium]|jgi:lipid A 3-O-deacylase
MRMNSKNAQALSALIPSVICAAVLFFSMHANVCAIDAVALELGTAAGDEDVDRIGVEIRWDWAAQWHTDGDWYLGGYWEIGAAYWDGKKGRTGNDSLGDFHVTPVLRYQRKPTASVIPFVEFGLGPHLHTDDSIGNKNFDIPFAFGSHVGGGLRFGNGGRYELLYRFQHLSNASLGDDNPGINFHVLNLGYRF